MIKTRYDLDLEIYTMKVDKPQAVIVLCHGASEHIERYQDFARFLNENNISVYGYNHPGHGPNRPQDSVYFADKDGDKLLIDTLEDVILYTYQHNADIPIYLLGHSMGSLITRAFCINTKLVIDGVIICGSLNPSNKSISSGSALASTLAKLTGKKRANKLVNKIAFGKLEDTLSYNMDNVKNYIEDKHCGMLFSNQAIVDLLKITKKVVNPINVKKMIDTDYFIISGKADPFSDGTNQLYDLMHNMNKGKLNYEYKFYDNMKHEILNETDNHIVYSDVLDFINIGTTKK